MYRLPPARVLITLAVAFVAFLASCSEKAPPDRSDQNKDKNYYDGIEPSLSLASLENEMAGAATNYLQSFAQDQIPWQEWDQNLLQKADQAQAPIFVLVGSGLGPSSRKVAREISRNDELREMVSGTTICAAVDVRVHSEMGLLAYQLSTEDEPPFALPMAIWMSPEGNPIAWFTIGPATDDKLGTLIENSTAMVNETWKVNSKYAVENSRFDNTGRQKRVDYDLGEEEPGVSRREIFRRSTRKLSSYYNGVEKQMDFVGGLLPTSSLELLTVGSRSHTLNPQTRARCREAVRAVATKLIEGAMRDPLDGGYYHARTSRGWLLPNFSKNLDSQARTATMFLQIGATLDQADFTREGLALLEKLETDWVARQLAIRSIRDEKIRFGSFLWSLQDLEDFLTKEEVQFAEVAFSLEKEGNIPFEADPLGKLAGNNTLRNESSLEVLAAASGTSKKEAGKILAQVKAKLLSRRNEKQAVVSEKTVTLTELAMVLQAQITRAAITGKDSDLQTATNSARELLANYWDPQIGLAKLRAHGKGFPGRGRDYTAVSFVLTLLHQLTLDDQWLSASTAILNHALENLTRESELLAEIPPEERIVPLRQHDVSMIFGETTMGFADRSATRLFALTGKKSYQDLLNAHLRLMALRPAETVVTHTDFVISCALGDSPLIALVRGNHASTRGRELLSVLNAPPNLPFLVIRPETSSSNLAPLPPLPPATGECSVVLLHNEDVLGQADTTASLTELLDAAIARQD